MCYSGIVGKICKKNSKVNQRSLTGSQKKQPVALPLAASGPKSVPVPVPVPGATVVVAMLEDATPVVVDVDANTEEPRMPKPLK